MDQTVLWGDLEFSLRRGKAHHCIPNWECRSKTRKKMHFHRDINHDNNGVFFLFSFSFRLGFEPDLHWSSPQRWITPGPLNPFAMRPYWSDILIIVWPPVFENCRKNAKDSSTDGKDPSKQSLSPLQQCCFHFDICYNSSSWDSVVRLSRSRELSSFDSRSSSPWLK